MSWRSDGCRFSGVHIARKLWADTEEGKCLSGKPVKEIPGQEWFDALARKQRPSNWVSTWKVGIC